MIQLHSEGDRIACATRDTIGGCEEDLRGAGGPNGVPARCSKRVGQQREGFCWKLVPDRKLTALAGHSKMRWLNGLSFGPNIQIYVADRGILDGMMQSKAHMRRAAPNYLFRFPADGTAPA